MALTDEGGMNTTMLVSPTGGYSNGGFGGFGGDGWWVILLLLLVAGGWNNGGGFGGNGGGYVPFAMNTGNDIQRGFDQSAIMSGIGDINAGINGIQNSICNSFAQAEIAENARQMANMNQMFGLSTQLAECCCANQLATCQTQNVIQTEGSATRFADANNTRDIIENQTRSTQLILDKLCQQEIDTLKSQNLALQNQLNIATMKESQTAQNALITQGFANEVDALYNRLNNCPVPTTPVYGRTPIFTCNQNQMPCGCGMA